MALRVAAISIAVLALCPAGVASTQAMSHNRANPIRKVVTLLQNMQKKVEAEGKKEEELYEKFMCYCKKGKGGLTSQSASADAKAAELGPSAEASEAKLAQLKEDVKKGETDRETAKGAMAEATALREKEAKEYAKESAEDQANIAAIRKALKALRAGVRGGFLQTSAADGLRHLLAEHPSLAGDSHDELASFLESDGSATDTNEIIGILSQMEEDMVKDAEEARVEEETAIREYEELMAAKRREVAALTKAIEDGLERIGELGVNIVSTKESLADFQEASAEDKAFLQDLEKACATKTAEWEERSKTRSEELIAIADTIKVLNDDDALELFKKTLPSASSFLQVQVTAKAQRARALAVLKRPDGHTNPGMDFIALALRGKKIGFDQVLGMIDDMTDILKTEQKEDEKKKAYCMKQLDESEDTKKAQERKISDVEAMISNTEEGIATLAEDIKALKESIESLDESVKESTEQRKKEHEEYVELMASDNAAKELIGFAKNRLNKFYNPKLFKAAPKRQLSDMDSITVNMGGTLAPTAAPGGIAGTGISLVQVSRHRQHRQPGPAPETFEGEYEKKTEENNGVIAMLDLLVKDLDKEMTEAETEEKDAQADYEKTMKDSATKRAEDSKVLASKEAAKDDLEEQLQEEQAAKASGMKELKSTEEYIADIHEECDWLLENVDARKEARSGELESLSNAKAVLNGADYSFLQTSSRRFLAHN